MKVNETLSADVKLSEEAIKVLDHYVFRKLCKLEESGLTDSYCYPKLAEAHQALNAALRRIGRERRCE